MATDDSDTNATHELDETTMQAEAESSRGREVEGFRAWAVLGGLTLALTGLAVACIIPDKGIVVNQPDDQYWCIVIDDAQGTNPSTQQLEDIDNFDACSCYTQEEDAVIDAQHEQATPSSAFELLRDRLEEQANADCLDEADAAGLGDPTNCATVSEAFDSADMYRSGDPGDCSTFKIYENDTDGNIPGGVPTGGLPPDPSDVITYLGSNEYEIDADFFEDILNYPAQLTLDDARIEEWPYGGYYFTNVSSGSVAYELGFRTNDKIIQLNGYWLGDLDKVLTAYQAVKNETSFTVKIQRGTNYIELYYDVI